MAADTGARRPVTARRRDQRALRDTLPPELAVLTALDRPGLVEQLGPRVDWRRVVELARHHRLAGALATALQATSAGRSAPDEVVAAVLADRDQRSARFETEVLPQLTEICAALAAAGCRATLLKGAALVCSGAVPAGARPLGDLDLLVARPDLEVATRVLEDLGYRMRARAAVRRWARVHHYQDPAYYHADRPLGVEVHWAIQEARHRLAFDPGSLETVELILPGGVPARRLSDRDQLTHLALHFWRDRAYGAPGALGQLWDVRRASPSVDDARWAEIRSVALERGHARVLAVVLACSHLLLDGPAPEAFPEVVDLAGEDVTSSFVIRRVLAPRPTAVQLLMVTPDVEYRAWRVLRRVAAQYRQPTSQLRAAYGERAAWRLRLHHVVALSRLLLELGRSPVETWAECQLDRWAHRLR